MLKTRFTPEAIAFFGPITNTLRSGEEGQSPALDGQRGRQVMELFRKPAHERDSGVIVVTHDHGALDDFDRTLVMEDGVLSGEGSVVKLAEV